MFTTYAGGNSGGWNGGPRRGSAVVEIALSGNREYGQMADAYAFAARLDYALASNLNVWGSYMWAHRLERAGWLGGRVNETDSTAIPGSGAGGFFAVQAVNTGNAAWNTHQPYVDDGFIGWEANVGVDWKLLEGLTFNMRYSYWQPGEWFEQAYQAIMLDSAGNLVRNGLLTGRDAINAFEGKLVIDF